MQNPNRILLNIFNQKNSSMLCIGVNKIKIHFDTSQLCCGVVHYLKLGLIFSDELHSFRLIAYVT